MIHVINTVYARALALAIIALAVSSIAAPAGAADICWRGGVTPEGHSYRVLYVPSEAIRLAAAGQAHNYVAIAIAFQGWVWAADDVPCRMIPWQHEIKHLDGWVHDANGRWTGKTMIAFAAGDGPRTPWSVIKIADDYRLVRNTDLAALPDPAN